MNGLDKLLPPHDMQALMHQVKSAKREGGQTVKRYVESAGLGIVAICTDGELTSWFASPVGSAEHLDVLELIILCGVKVVSASTTDEADNAARAAYLAIQRAAKRP